MKTEAGVECTMCGDHGFPDHLFKCTACAFRSQHIYCSDLYPKAETYRVCNWCLREKEVKAWKEQIEGSYVSRSTCNNNTNKRSTYGNRNCNTRDLQRHFPMLVNPIKKHRPLDLSADELGFPVEKKNSKKQQQQKHCKVVRKRSLGCKEELLRRSKSGVISKVEETGILRKTFRGKAQRYKLLEECSG